MISPKAFLDRILRLPFSLIPNDAEVRILRGPLRGRKWIKGAGPNAYWVGTYEAGRIRGFAGVITPGFVVYDVGANVGIYSLLASQLVGPLGRVYAFEPLARNLRYLRQHIKLNNLENCTVVEKAVCKEDGTRRFSATPWQASMAKLSPDGERLVPATTLDSCVYGELKLRPPDVIKIDVEGAELEVLEGATKVISEFYPIIFLELHGIQLHNDCRDLLLAKRYRIAEAYAQITATRMPPA